MITTWPYFSLKADGYLYDEYNGRFMGTPKFSTTQEAEQWLTINDIRGTVI